MWWWIVVEFDEKQTSGCRRSEVVKERVYQTRTSKHTHTHERRLRMVEKMAGG
jgi:hypothetical protein